jgi:hypothetical protein
MSNSEVSNKSSLCRDVNDLNLEQSEGNEDGKDKSLDNNEDSSDVSSDSTEIQHSKVIAPFFN